MNRRLFTLLLALTMLCTLFAACDKQGEKPTKPDESAASDKQPDTVDLSSFKVGFAQDTLNQPWRSYQADCVVAEFKKHGINCTVTDGQGSAEKQAANIEDMISGGLDLLVVSPAQEAALAPAVSEAFKQGVPVVCIDRGVTSNDFTCYCHADNYTIGSMAADWIAEQFTAKFGSPKGNVVVLEGVPGSTTAVQRGTAFSKRIKEAYPDIKIIASQPADYNRAKAMTIMEDFLQTYDKIDAVFTHADESTMGAILAIENSGRRKEMLICSVNGTTEGIEAILNGRMDMTVMYTNASGPGVEMAIRVLKGEKVPKNITIDPIVVDAGNAQKYYFEGTYSPDPMPLVEGSYTKSDDYKY